MPESGHAIDRVSTRSFRIPTDRPESDGTLTWDATTVVIVEVRCDGRWGLGYTYGPRAIAGVIGHELIDIVLGSDPLSPQRTWETMHAALRNAGQGGMGAMAIAAVDIALHDLRARILDLPLAVSLGAVRDTVPIYGSGGFTSDTLGQLGEQLAGWVDQKIPRVKMKVGRHPDQDPARLTVAREAIGADTELMVDANGAFTVEQAIGWAQRYAEFAVRWFEEPVTQDDPAGLRRVREHAPPEMAVASGEYSWSRYDTTRLLRAKAVDVAQADVTRCCGPTELTRIDALCAGVNLPLSLHCAPAISAHVGCALEQLAHLEYFHDHVRVEDIIFDGTLSPENGALRPDLSRPGHGLQLKAADAERYGVT
jgi:L-alanine-DL-glutamate epimerase-like enolase superfamily enzyme